MIPSLHLSLFGGFLLVSGKTPVTTITLPRVQFLLAYLVLHRSAPQDRSHLAFLLWPDSTEAQAHTNLRQLLYHLRRSLPYANHLVFADKQSLHWHPVPEVAFSLDVEEFEQALAKAEQADQIQDLAGVRQALEQAIHLYHGDLFPNCYEEWIFPERDRLHQLFLQAAQRLLEILEQERDYSTAINVAGHLLRQDPLHEATYRQLMCLHAITGDRAAALRTYHRCASLLERELGMMPSETTRQMYERLVQKDAATSSVTSSPTPQRTAPLIPLWAVPFPRNLFFTGREETLARLHQHLGSNHSIALTQATALHGLGGVGKTQIALEYAYQHRMEYRAIFWLAAETAESIVASLLSIAQVLQVSGREDKGQQRIVAAVQQWLSIHPGWLLIWDNVEDLDLLRRFLPPSQQGAMLLTTRLHALGTLSLGLELAPMKQEEGVLFLLRRAKVLSPDATDEQLGQFTAQRPCESAAAAALVTAMGGLPLALDQAGAYLEETQCGLPAYLELFRERRAALLQRRGEESSEHPESVYTTFQLSITRATSHHPAVRDLLRVCALLQPDAIPEELFRQGAEHWETALQAACVDELEWNRVVALACRYSLLSRQAEQQTLSIHRLVQAVLLDEMHEDEREQWTKRAVAALDVVFPEVQPEAKSDIWKRAECLLPHVQLCLPRTGTSSQSLASLAFKTAGYLNRCGQYEQAELLFQRALAIWEQALGPDHPQVAYPLSGLALLYREQGKYEQAELLFQRALAIWEQALGPDHPQVAYPLIGLARLYQEQGKYEQAEALYQRALSIWEGALGREHHLVAIVLNDLANLYREQSHYRKAELLYQQALSIKEQHLGPHHLETAQTLHDLATYYRLQGYLAKATLLYRRALQIREQALGDGHPQTLATRMLYTRLIQQEHTQEGRACGQ